jgi:hypothetical protein
MPRMLDLIKASSVPANLVQAAARGALSVPAEEVLEILVFLTHNPVFREQAELTLAGWDEKASVQAARDSKTPIEVLTYFIAPQNLRSCLLPALLDNPAIRDEVLIPLAADGSREVVRGMMASARVRESQKILNALTLNPQLTSPETEQLKGWLAGLELRVVGGTESGLGSEASEGSSVGPSCTLESPLDHDLADHDLADHDLAAESPEVAEAVRAFEREYAADIAAEEGTPFRPMGGTYGLESEEIEEAPADAPEPTPAVATHAVSKGGAAAAPARKKPKPEPSRESVLQKIARLDVKGRVKLALLGGKEERSILVRDGTKIVALAVLDSPKISDGEVEKFAGQKNVLETLLRGIAMRRRFIKNYNIVRNLTFNPRTPIDLTLTLGKNLMTQDLKNLSNNKEISDTVRKMALRMYKQKMSTAKSD